MSPAAGLANLDFAKALLGSLHEAGAIHAYVCPGSRSSPLALALALVGMPHSVRIDERQAGFEALGMAKCAQAPVLLIVTSGTAGANLLPAVAEAAQARVPLVVLSADRPPELRQWGAAQTMEQRQLYAPFVRYAEEAPCPDAGLDLAYARALARRALEAACAAAPGPVHLNLPFREPLLPASIAAAEFHTAPRAIATRRPPSHAVATLDAIWHTRLDARRGVLLAGPDACPPGRAQALAQLAQTLGWPLIADPASGLRAQPALASHLIHHADLFLRDADRAAALRPQIVLRCGSLPTSKALAQWLARHPEADYHLLDPGADWRDPTHRCQEVLRLQPEDLLAALPAAPRPAPADWLAAWRDTDARAGAALTQALSEDGEFGTPLLARTLWQALPPEALLYVANSMPIRDLDAYAGARDTPLRVLCNRGVNGIDGQIASALGAAAAHAGPSALWCGDLAFLHDLGGLLAARQHARQLCIVLSHDDGGGIFEYLPVAQAIPRSVFETLFGTPHGLDLAALAAGLGCSAHRVQHAEGLRQALDVALRGGVHVIEVRLDRARNTAQHRALQATLQAALREAP